MPSFCEQYFLAHSVEEALEILSTAQGHAKILAGGSDLLLEVRQGTHPSVKTMVDVTEIEEMCALEICNQALFIGACVTLERLKNSGLIQLHAQALADATLRMANPQVCNVATIGGNIMHALPAADGSIALLALDAQAEIANAGGRRRIPLQNLFEGPGKTILDPNDDILVGFYLPVKGSGQASAFVRRVNPKGIALAMVNMAFWLERRENKIAHARIAVGPSGRIPLRMYAAEKMLINQVPSLEVRDRAMQEMTREAHFRNSPQRATAEYRWQLAGVLLEEAFMIAWQRAK